MYRSNKRLCFILEMFSVMAFSQTNIIIKIWKKSEGKYGHLLCSIFSLVIILLSYSNETWAWTGDTDQNTAIATASGDQEYPEIVSDGAGGAIIKWNDTRNERDDGRYDTYIQRIDARGNLLWENGFGTDEYDGIALGYGGWSQIVSDGSGGAIVTGESIYGGIYVQRINGDGKPLWGDGTGTGDYKGIPVAYTGYFGKIVSDGSGGAIILWRDWRNADYDIYAQRIDAAGNRLWENGPGTGDYNGIPICTAASDQEIFEFSGDGNGGAIVTWMDKRSGTDEDIYAQRIDAKGTRVWENGSGTNDYEGIPISLSAADAEHPVIDADGSGGAIIAWWDNRNGNSDIYAQRVDAGGNRLWENGSGSGDFNGIPVSMASGGQFYPALLNDGSGGATIAFLNIDKGGAIYAQRIDPDGNRLWENGTGTGNYDGIPVSISTGSWQTPQIISDDSGSVIITWVQSCCNYYDIYAQKIDSKGNRLWENGAGTGDYHGIPIADNAGGASSPRIINDGDGGAIITWQDHRNGSDWHIYAQKIYSNGTLPKNDLMIDFGPAARLWIKYNDSSWKELVNLSPEIAVSANLDGNGQDDIVVDFGRDVGIMIYYNDVKWTKLHSRSSEIIAAGDMDGSGADDLIVDFGPGTGIWVYYDNRVWKKLHNKSPEIIATGDMDGSGADDVIIDFGPAAGIWVYYDNAVWKKLHSKSPEHITAGDMDGLYGEEVVIDFGSSDGIWIRYNDRSWKKLHKMTADVILIGNVDGT